jgi:hypothetical protein
MVNGNGHYADEDDLQGFGPGQKSLPRKGSRSWFLMWHSQTALAQLIDDHLQRYPAMEPRDVYKLLYQGVMGMGHLVVSPEGFAARLRTEYEAVSPGDVEPLWETVRPDGALGRLNLRPFRVQQGDVESLIVACLRTAQRVWGTPEDLQGAWATFVTLCQSGEWEAFPLREVLAFSARLEKHAYPAVHHSAHYREAYKPAYRLVGREFLFLIESANPDR